MSRRKKIAVLAASLALLFVMLFAIHASQEVPVLMYHFVGSEREASEDSLVVSVRTFEQHLKWLEAWGYDTLSLSEYSDHLSGQQRLRRKAILITFDDGNFSFYERVYPLLSKYQVKAANFLVADNLLNRQHGSMSLDQAKELSLSPLVSFGSHTVHHKILKDLTDQEFREEIRDSKHLLSMVIGQKLSYFCYPGGYFDDRALSEVKESGYALAFTTSYKRLEGRPWNRHAIPRVKMTEKDRNPFRFWFKVSGIYSAAQSLRFQILRLIHLS